MSLYEYRGILIRWVDADTAVVSLDLGFRHWMHDEHLRLVGINAPDKQPAKSAATKIANELCPVGSSVIVRTEKDKQEKYGRWLAELFIPDPIYPISVNRTLVERGAAVFWDGTGVRPESAA